jgi:hypothetical protein
LVTGIITAIRKGFSRADITAEQIHRLAILLFALERLPLATPGVSADLTLSFRNSEGSSFQNIHLDEGSLSLSSGGYVHTPDIGGDSYSAEILMVEVGGFRDAKRNQFADWLAEFKARLEDAEIEITVDDADVDWSNEPDGSSWETAAQKYAVDLLDED